MALNIIALNLIRQRDFCCRLIYNVMEWKLVDTQSYTGADPGFQVRGYALKKLRRAQGGAKIVGVFRVKNHDFSPKHHIFSNFRGGGARTGCVPPPPGSAPEQDLEVTQLKIKQIPPSQNSSKIQPQWIVETDKIDTPYAWPLILLAWYNNYNKTWRG